MQTPDVKLIQQHLTALHAAKVIDKMPKISEDATKAGAEFCAFLQEIPQDKVQSTGEAGVAAYNVAGDYYNAIMPEEAPAAAEGEAVATDGKGKSKGKKKGGATGVGKGPGIIATIEEMVKGATKAKPITKDAILTALKAKFPDRDAESMSRTVGIQLPHRLKADKGLKIESVEQKEGEKTVKAYFVAA
jgi:hypothetical protein